MILQCDSLGGFPLADGSVQCCVTSPPYWGLRDYGMDGQLGLESTHGEYVSKLVGVFAEVWRVLKDDGVVWLNLGDTYYSGNRGNYMRPRQGKNPKSIAADFPRAPNRQPQENLKNKDLVGIPWMVAFALRSAGWWLRSENIWEKPNCQPENVRDRTTRSHEHLFMLSKSAQYYYDADAIMEPLESDPASWGRHSKKDPGAQALRPRPMFGEERGGRDGTDWGNGVTRNKRTVWRVATTPFPDAHFATFPPKLIEPCIRAGSRAGDVVLDPFGGAMTTGLVCAREGRRFVGLELNREYCEMGKRRIYKDAPLLSGTGA